MKEFGEKIKAAEYSPRRGSYGVIVRGDRAGVVKPVEYDAFFLVGGGINRGETPPQALRREALEEIGCEIETGEKLGAAIEYFYSTREGKHIAKECHFYRISLLGKTAEKSEHELIWISRERLGEMRHRSHQWIIEKELARI